MSYLSELMLFSRKVSLEISYNFIWNGKKLGTVCPVCSKMNTFVVKVNLEMKHDVVVKS